MFFLFVHARARAPPPLYIIHVRRHTCVCAHARVHVCIHLSLFTCVHVHTQTCLSRARVHVHVHTCVHARARACTHMHRLHVGNASPLCVYFFPSLIVSLSHHTSILHSLLHPSTPSLTGGDHVERVFQQAGEGRETNTVEICCDVGGFLCGVHILLARKTRLRQHGRRTRGDVLAVLLAVRRVHLRVRRTNRGNVSQEDGVSASSSGGEEQATCGEREKTNRVPNRHVPG
jgi:hypothetical protein